MEDKYLICEDTLEGILTGVYAAYALKVDHNTIHLQIGEEDNLRLFASYLTIRPDPEKSAKVARTIRNEFGEDVFLDFCYALSTPSEEKAEAVYKTIVYGLPRRDKRQIMSHLANPYVFKVFELRRNAYHEIHHLTGFLRFQELESGILSAKVGPKNNVVTFLAPHFADRFPLENFIIYDEMRGIHVVHPASGQWYVVLDMQVSEENMRNYSEKEGEYKQLFVHFCNKIAIEGRKNLKLQRNNLPLRFQDYMVEFGN